MSSSLEALRMSSAAASFDLDAEVEEQRKKEMRRLSKKRSRQKIDAEQKATLDMVSEPSRVANQEKKQMDLDWKILQKQWDDEIREETRSTFNREEASRKRLAYHRQKQQRLDDVQPGFDQEFEDNEDDEPDRPPSGGAFPQHGPTSKGMHHVFRL